MSQFIEEAKGLVRDHYNINIKPWGDDDITTDEVFVVWFCKTLQHWKALLSTTIPDTRYYELTHNGDKDETYVDTYLKESNFAVTREAILPSVG